MKNVAITGVSGYIGTLLLKRLVQETEIERIIGIDVEEPSFQSPKFTFIEHDVRRPFEDLFVTYKCDTAIHLAFIVAPIRDETKAHDININGSKNFLDASAKAKVAQIFYLGSHTEYGAHGNNPDFFTEDMSLNPNKDYPYPVDKAQVDTMFQEHANNNPGTCVTIGRTVAVTGPCGNACGLTVLFLPVMIKAAGKNPLWQFIHEDDMAELVFRLLKERKGGIYNLAAEGGLTYNEMIKKLGKPSITLPPRLLYRSIQLTWKIRLQSRGQAGGLFLLEYPIIVSNEKVKKETGYKLRHSAQEAFDIFLKTKAEK
jgi:UDP-glucose 4-epimerase